MLILERNAVVGKMDGTIDLMVARFVVLLYFSY
jgi:hypothetical protein